MEWGAIMLSVAICDDIEEEITLIENKVKEILKKLDTDYQIYILKNKDEIFFNFSNNNIDVLLLDINMPEMNGYEVAKVFGDKVGYIIFVSSNDDYVYDSVKYKPYRFARKTHLDELEEAFNSILSYRSNDDGYFIDIKTVGSGRMAIRLNDIVYLESNGSGHSVLICAEEHTYEVRVSLKNMEPKLNKNFMRVHKGFIINLNKIYLIKRFEVLLGRNGGIVTVPLSRNTYMDVKNRFIEVMKR